MQREYPEGPLVGVGAVIVHEERVLLIRRGTEPMKGRWSIPGGLVELGESLSDALRREIREETGLEVEPVALVELLDRIYTEEAPKNKNKKIRYHYVIADYLCRLIAGKACAGSDAAEVHWAARAEWLAESGLDLDSVTARIIEAGWQKAHKLEI